MRLSIVSLLGFATGLTIAAECPYMKHVDERDVAALSPHSVRARSVPGKKGVMLMNRIGPSTSTLYVANTDGTNERQLFNESTFDYHAAFSPDGEWITFTSERNGLGNSDLFRCRLDGSGVEQIVATSSFEDRLVVSPDGTQGAYISTANGYVANLWVMDMEAGAESARNLTNTESVKGVAWSPDSYFSPSWSPDGEWIAFASDRNTNWTGHGNGTGWEHTQELSVYVIRPNGTDFRQVATKAGYSLGSPKWSPDGTRLVYYEITREQTWNAHRPEDLQTTNSTIVSVDVATGLDRVEESSSVGLKLAPQYVTQTEIGYHAKSPAAAAGLTYSSNVTSVIDNDIRSPAWSPDGTLVVYEKQSFDAWVQEAELYSWDSEWDYRYTDVFPALSSTNKVAITEHAVNSSLITMNPDGSDQVDTFNTFTTGQVTASDAAQGQSGAFMPAWSPDGEWLAFGLGSWFQLRAVATGWLYRVRSNGSDYEQLTDGSVNTGFPSYSHDGQSLVYRVWGAVGSEDFGLRIMNLTDKSVTTLTTGLDNLPGVSPDGEKIVFTRRANATNYDVYTIRPDGSDLTVVTSSGANDAHAVWAVDGRIMYSSGMYGFRTEAALYDDTFQPYGQIFIMNADGSNKTILTDSMWEDSMPLYLLNEVLG